MKILPVVRFFGQKFDRTLIEPPFESLGKNRPSNWVVSTVVGAAPTVLSLFVFRDHLLYGKNRSKVTISACFSR